MVIKAVLFDHDGTLVDSEQIHYQLWVDVLQSHGVELTAQEYKESCSGIPTLANATMFTEKYSLAVEPAELAQQKNAQTHVYLEQAVYPLMAGVKEVLEFLKQRGILLAVVTGADRHGAQSSMRGHGLDDFFDTIVSGDDVQKSKPAPDCYVLAMKRSGIHADECIAIEDTQHGLAAATAAGIACLVVPNAMTDRHDFSKATQVLSDLNAVKEWFTKHLN